MQPELEDLDPFDLPEWLGVGDVTWSAESGVRSGHDVRGTLVGDGHELACDLLAVDDAWPEPVAADRVRVRAHQAWRSGQVYVVSRAGRLTLTVPGSAFTADLVLDALSRLAKAVGASPEHYTARLRIGSDRRR